MPELKGWTLYVQFITFWRNQKYKDSNQTSGCQSLGNEDGTNHERIQGNFGVIKILCILSIMVVSLVINLSKFIEKYL